MDTKIVILPTDKRIEGGIMKSIPGRNPDSRLGILHIAPNLYTIYDNGWEWQFQNLHVLSDDEIKVGDWVYNIYVNDISQVQDHWDLSTMNNGDQDSKIVASTDKSLILPYPHDSVIEKFIKERNKDIVLKHTQSDSWIIK